MSLLSLCQNVVAETGYGTPPITIVNNTDSLAVQLLALANAAAKKVMREHNWQATISAYTAATTAGTNVLVQLSSDAYQLIGDTGWDTTNLLPVGGALTPQQFNAFTYANVGNASVRRRIALIGKNLMVFPTPTVTGDQITFWAVFKFPVFSDQYQNIAATFLSDADSTVVPEELVRLCVKWMLIRAKGFDHSEEYNEYQRAVQLAIARDTPAGAINDSRLSPDRLSLGGFNLGSLPT